MVQLKPFDLSTVKYTVPLFQFHNGTIKTLRSAFSCIGLGNFNSIMVQLKLGDMIVSAKSVSYFNSIMVQLKPHRHL